MKKISILLALAALAAVLTVSCSAVFESGLSGTIVDKETSAGISGVRVFAYTDEALRNSDFDKGVTIDGTGVKYTFSPSLSGNYIPTTSTDANGNFTISKLVWKTTKPEFGKTADYTDVYLLYFHPDYGLMKESEKVTVVSDSNNSSRVSSQMESRMETKSLNLNITNVAYLEGTDDTGKADGSGLTDSVIVHVKAYKAKTYDASGAVLTWYAEPYIDTEYSVTGITDAGGIPVYYEKDEDCKVKVELELEIPADSTWANVKKTGDAQPYTYYKNPDTLAWTLSDAEIRALKTSDSFDILMKGYEFNQPAVSGLVATEAAAADNEYEFNQPAVSGLVATEAAAADNEYVDVWLGTSITDDGTTRTLYVPGNPDAHVTTGHTGDGSNGGITTYGTFSGLGTGLTWTPVEILTDGDHKGDYPGKIGTRDVYVVIDDKVAGGTKVGVPDRDDYFVKVSLSSRYLNDVNIGKIDTDKAKTGIFDSVVLQ